MKSLEIHSQAKAEFDGAAKWYEKRRKGLGADFRRVIEDALRQIQAKPSHYPSQARPGYRKCFVRRFPYIIIFAELVQIIWVVAFAHHKRRPDYWIRRKPPSP